MSKTGFTIDEHIKLGNELNNIRHYLIGIQFDIAKKYVTSGIEYMSIMNTLKNIDRFRSVMEEAAYKEYPNENCVKMYYPGGNDE